MVRYGRRKIGRSFIYLRYFVLESRLLAYYKRKPQDNVVPIKTLVIDGNCRAEDGGLKTQHGHCLGTAGERDRFQDLLPAMMRTLTVSLNGGEEATAQEALELLIELAGTELRFLRRQIVEVVGAMLQIVEAERLEEGTRHLAIEFVVTLAEARERALGMMRKLPQFVRGLFGILIRVLLDIEDEPAWHSAESEDEDVGESSNYSFGQECLDRLAIALGGNTIVPVASELLPAYLVAPDWQKTMLLFRTNC